MSKQIKVSDPLYERIKGAADSNYRSMAGEIEWMMDFIGGRVGVPEQSAPPQKITTPEIPQKSERKRSLGDILADINAIEREKEDALAYNQDPDSRKQVAAQYGATLDELWAEYNEAKGA